MPDTLTLTSLSADHTSRIAQALSPHLSAGDVLLLTGDVGAGKTHFARAVIQSLLSEPEDVPSPTYTLVQTYTGQACEIWHADLYRLGSTFEIEELGLTEAFTQAICLVEWPDRLGELMPQDGIEIAFQPGPIDDTRQMTLRWNDPRWANKTKGLQDV
jgi:tRNA threonylcarbamoyladenosine biosynthesis protein TsaE